MSVLKIDINRNRVPIAVASPFSASDDENELRAAQGISISVGLSLAIYGIIAIAVYLLI
jgi:hypothetical protein